MLWKHLENTKLGFLDMASRQPLNGSHSEQNLLSGIGVRIGHLIGERTDATECERPNGQESLFGRPWQKVRVRSYDDPFFFFFFYTNNLLNHYSLKI
jgi:hypothetical protein